MKEILLISDDVTRVGRYRTLFEDGMYNINLRATVGEGMDFKELIDIVIIDLDIPRIKKSDIRFTTSFIKRGIKVFFIVDEITDEGLIECEQNNITVFKKTKNYDNIKNTIELEEVDKNKIYL